MHQQYIIQLGNLLQTNRLRHRALTSIINNHQENPHTKWGILDSGATGHFVKVDTPLKNKCQTHTPLCITIPNGKQLLSRHDGELDLPHLPPAACKAHIVPGLTSTSLITIRKLTIMGCTVIFDQHQCRVYFQNKIILIGEKDPITDLWQIPLQQHQLPINQQTTHANDEFPLPNQQVQHMASNLYTLPYKQQQIKYMHQTFFAPPHTTLLEAIDKGHLKSIPFMTRDNVMNFWPTIQKLLRVG